MLYERYTREQVETAMRRINGGLMQTIPFAIQLNMAASALFVLDEIQSSRACVIRWAIKELEAGNEI